MLDGHDKAILQFSGGKDSAALLYMARPYLDRITVHFCDPGSTFPHVVDFVHETCARLGADLRVIRPQTPLRDYIAQTGLPTDLLPMENMVEFAAHLPEKTTLLQSPWRCCWAMYFLPMYQAVLDSGIKLVLRGSKGTDSRLGVPDQFVDENGIEYRSPLWQWTHADVLAYLAREGVKLPKHYDVVTDSLDCTLCTAYLGEQYEGAKRLRYVRDHHPDIWPELAAGVRTVKAVVEAELAKLEGAWNA